MQVILLDKVENLGALGDLVDVKPGFARNFLIPQGRAKMATPSNIEAFEATRAALEAAAKERIQAAEALREQLQGKTVLIEANAGGEGKLFGSVGAADIAEAIQAQLGVELDRRVVRLADGVIRATGEFEIGLHLHAEVDAELSLAVRGIEQ